MKSGRAQALQIDTPTADYFAATSATDFDVLPTLLTASQNNAIYLKPGDFKWWLWLRHLRVRAAHGFALSQVRGNLPEVGSRRTRRHKVLPAASALAAGLYGPIPGLVGSLRRSLSRRGGLDARRRDRLLRLRLPLGRHPVFPASQRGPGGARRRCLRAAFAQYAGAAADLSHLFRLSLVGLLWPASICGGLALVLQNGAYICEIFRGAYKAIDRVQHDAAKSLGLMPWTAFRKGDALLQLLVHSIPTLGNQAVLLLKDTSLLSAITVVELTMQAKVLTERTGAAYAPFWWLRCFISLWSGSSKL